MSCKLPFCANSTSVNPKSGRNFEHCSKECALLEKYLQRHPEISPKCETPGCNNLKNADMKRIYHHCSRACAIGNLSPILPRHLKAAVARPAVARPAIARPAIAVADKDQRKQQRVAIYQDNISIVSRDARLSEQRPSCLINLDRIPPAPITADMELKIEFLACDSNEAIHFYTTAGARVTAVNFANANHAGGGVSKGAIAQEEDLCLQSNLLGALNQFTNNGSYTDWGSQNWNKKLIYSNDITFFRNSPLQLLNPRDRFISSIVSVAAPNFGRSSRLINDKKSQAENDATIKRASSDPALFEEFEKMIRGTYFAEEIAQTISSRKWQPPDSKRGINFHTDVLVLGAWGCGAFAPTADDGSYKANIATCFANVLKSVPKKYDVVCFAIPPSHGGDPTRDNLNIFRKVFMQNNINFEDNGHAPANQPIWAPSWASRQLRQQLPTFSVVDEDATAAPAFSVDEDMWQDATVPKKPQQLATVQRKPAVPATAAPAFSVDEDMWQDATVPKKPQQLATVQRKPAAPATAAPAFSVDEDMWQVASVPRRHQMGVIVVGSRVEFTLDQLLLGTVTKIDILPNGTKRYTIMGNNGYEYVADSYNNYLNSPQLI